MSLGGAGQAISRRANGESSTSSENEKKHSSASIDLVAIAMKQKLSDCRMESTSCATMCFVDQASRGYTAEGCATSCFSYWFNRNEMWDIRIRDMQKIIVLYSTISQFGVWINKTLSWMHWWRHVTALQWMSPCSSSLFIFQSPQSPAFPLRTEICLSTFSPNTSLEATQFL